jgi:hypothetical protein
MLNSQEANDGMEESAIHVLNLHAFEQSLMVSLLRCSPSQALKLKNKLQRVTFFEDG